MTGTAAASTRKTTASAGAGPPVTVPPVSMDGAFDPVVVLAGLVDLPVVDLPLVDGFADGVAVAGL